jgi:hypothetical protein
VRDFRDRLAGDIPSMPAERRKRRQEHLRRAVGAAVAPGSSAMSAIMEPVSGWRLIATWQKKRRKSAVFRKNRCGLFMKASKNFGAVFLD